MVDIDIKNLIGAGPDKLVMAIINAVKTERSKESFETTKVLHTYIFESTLKAEISISSGGSSASKTSGIIKWIGDRKDGNAGVEVYVESRDSNNTFTFGTENLERATFNSEKRMISVSQVPKTCPVCKGVIAPSDSKIQCPACKIEAHRDHFLEYLKIHGTCPSCKKRLSMKGKS